MAFTPWAGGTWQDARGQTYRFDIGHSDIASGTYYRFGGTNQWMTYDAFWKQVGMLQDRVAQNIRAEEQQKQPNPIVPPSQPADDRQGADRRPLVGPISVQQKDSAQNVVNATTSTLTDSIPRPKTARATPTPVSQYRMNKTKGKFTIGI